MKRCTDMPLIMSEAIDGRLDADALAELEAHIETCADCRREYDALRQTVALLRDVPAMAPPSDMATRVRARLAIPRGRRFRWPVLGQAPMRVALAASLLIGISIYAFLRPGSVPVSDETAVALPAERARDAEAIASDSLAAFDRMDAEPLADEFVFAPLAALDPASAPIPETVLPDPRPSIAPPSPPPASPPPASPPPSASPPSATVPLPPAAPRTPVTGREEGPLWRSQPERPFEQPGLRVGEASETPPEPTAARQPAPALTAPRPEPARMQREAPPLDFAVMEDADSVDIEHAPEPVPATRPLETTRRRDMETAPLADTLGGAQPARSDVAFTADETPVQPLADRGMSRLVAMRASARNGAVKSDDVSAFGANTAAAASAQRDLALALYLDLAGSHDGNLFFSPYSVSAALGMAYAGAGDNTAREIAAVLHWPKAQIEWPTAFRDLDRRLKAAARADGQILKIANGLCLTGNDLGQAYKTMIRQYFDAEIFTGGLDDVNMWVAGKTEGRIPKIIDQLDPNSVAVILNAIYFKGAWQDAFNPALTRDEPFTVSPDRQVNIPMMTRRGRYRLLDGDGFQALAIPYRGETLSMIVLLPNVDMDVGAFEARLTPRSLSEMQVDLARRAPQPVRLTVPRFKLETGYDLIPSCRRLGMQEAFIEDLADFSGMGWPKGDLWISQIKHRAFLQVNEEGTEAAAATAVEMGTTAMPPPEAVFRADRPFLFLIQDQATGSILFMGRLLDPTAAQ